MIPLSDIEDETSNPSRETRPGLSSYPSVVLGSTHSSPWQLVESFTVLWILIATYEEVSSLDKREAGRTQAAHELHDQVKNELEVSQSLHGETNIWLRIASEVTYGKLVEAQLELRNARVEENVSRLRAEGVSLKIGTAQDRIQELEANLEAHVQSEDGWQATFLLSPNFKRIVSDHAYFYFETDFDWCRYQFEEVGLIPIDMEDFPSFDKAIAFLPNDEDEQ